MLTRFADWLRRRRDARAAAARAGRVVTLVRDASASRHPDWQTLGRHRIDVVEDGHIVTLLHEVTRPPQRSWWHVDETDTVTELAYDQVVMRIHIPIWR